MIVVGVVRNKKHGYVKLTIAPGLSTEMLVNYVEETSIRIVDDVSPSLRDIVDMALSPPRWIPRDALHEAQDLELYVGPVPNHPELED